jgi:hypothetical protein
MLTQRRQDETEATGAPDIAPERPTLRSIAPHWAELVDKWAEMQRREEAILAELAEINPQVAKAGGHSSAESMPRQSPAPQPTEHPSAVVELLGKLTPKREVRDIPRPAFVGLKARAISLSQELDTIREARDVLLPEIRRAHLLGSAALCRALAPEYQIIADKVCDALLALGEAAVLNEEWLADLRRQGAAFSMLRPVLVRGPDESGDPIARIRRLLEWAAEGGGWFDAAQIPTAWRKRS